MRPVAPLLRRASGALVLLAAAGAPSLRAQGPRPIPLAVAFADADGDGRPDRRGEPVRIAGTVIWAPRDLGDSLQALHIQDGTRGIRVTVADTILAGRTVPAGYRVEVVGIVARSDRGEDVIRGLELRVTAGGEPPEPQGLPLRAVATRFAGELVRVTGRIDVVGDSVFLRDATARLRLRLGSQFYRAPGFTDHLRRARAATVVGIVEEHRETPAYVPVHRLRPRAVADVQLEPRPPYHALVALAVGLVLLLGIVYVASRRRAAERRAREIEAHAAALSRSEASFRSFVDGCPFGVYRSSLDGRFLAVNRALVDMLGYASAEELSQGGVTALYGRPEQREALIRRQDASGRIDREVEWRRHDGSPLLAHLSGRVLTDTLGRPEGFEVFVNDVTGRRALEGQLQQAQKMEAIGQFSGGLAHDFNNVLAAILANVEFLADSLPDGSGEQRRCLEETAAAASLGARVVRRLMTFARASELRPRPIDLNDLLSDFAALARRLLPSSIELRCVGEGVRRVIANADSTAVEQILLNLTTNARDAMPGGGVLLLAAEVRPRHEGATHSAAARSGSYPCIVVSDSGVGMDDATRQRIFEPFFTTKDTGRGTGLGLAMVAALMHQQDGYVECQSAPGAGTTFRLYFPDAEATERVPEQREDSHEPPRGHEHILVVDDDAPVRCAAARTLRSLGYRVLEAETAEEAVGVFLRAGDVDLVLTDIGLPDLSGPDLYRALTTVSTPRPVVFMSGSAPHDGPSAARHSGGATLQKPWTRAELALSVRQALDQPHGPSLS